MESLQYGHAIAYDTREEQATFIKKTYLHVALAVLSFVLLELVIFQSGLAETIAQTLLGGRWTWLIVLGAFMFISTLANKWSQSSTSMGMQYAGLALYVIAEAIIFVPLLYMAIMITGSVAVIEQAAYLTLFLFAGLSAVVLITKKDFSFLRNILTVGFFVALGIIVLGIIFGFELGLFFSGAMVVLAAGSILYQTSAMMKNYERGQYVAAALGLFASLMLLFWYILRILIALSGRD